MSDWKYVDADKRVVSRGNESCLATREDVQAYIAAGGAIGDAFTLDDVKAKRIEQINAEAESQIEAVGGWTVKKQLNAERGMYSSVNANAAAHSRAYVNAIVHQSNALCDAVMALTTADAVMAYATAWDHTGLVSYELMKTGV